VLGAKQAEAERRLHPELTAYRAASRADWLPMEYDFKLTDVVYDLGGRDAVLALSRASFLAAANAPILRPIVQGTLQVFGVTPRAAVKIVRASWDVGTKDGGQMTTTRTDGHSAAVVFEGINAKFHWFESFIGVFWRGLRAHQTRGHGDRQRCQQRRNLRAAVAEEGPVTSRRLRTELACGSGLTAPRPFVTVVA